jgi:hypothetical protein
MTAPNKSALDLSALSVTDAPAPERETSGRERRENPFDVHMKASADNKTDKGDGRWVGAGKAVTVPRAAATEVSNLLNYAANHLHVGVTKVFETNDKAPEKPLTGWRYGVKDVPRGQVRVRFAAKSRKQKRSTDNGSSAS